MSARRLLAPSLLLGLAACSADALPDGVLVSDDAPATPTERVQGQYLVRLASTDVDILDGAVGALGARDLRPAGLAGVYAFTADQEPDEVATVLSVDDEVLWVEPMVRVDALGVPNDPYYGYQWHMADLGLPELRDVGAGEGVIVAVVDTGVTARSDGFAHLLVGYDAVLDQEDGRNDGNGHGSHVAGTIAQATNNAIGVAGLAAGASILPVRVLDASGSGTSLDVAEGIVWAVDHGAQVINLSLGAGAPMAVVEDACAYAASRGVLVVAAAGNDEGGPVGWPAAYPSVLAVSATDATGGLAWYSNVGPEVEITAPGGDTTVDANGDGYGDGVLQETGCSGAPCYAFFQGTSMATPHVAGAAALLFGAGVGTADEVRALLVGTARDIGAPGRDTAFGYGALDALAALHAIGDAPSTCEADRCATDLAPGDLLITEVMADPSACTDATGEWIELYNATTGTIDLTGVLVSDADGHAGAIVASRPLSAGEHAVVGRRDAATFCGPDAIGHYGSAVTLNNGADQVFLDTDVAIAQSAPWSAAARGTSIELDPSAYAAPTDAAWGPSVTPVGNGELATPNAASTPPETGDTCAQPPAPAVTAPCDRAAALCVDELAEHDITVTELMADPTAAADACAEWIEIANHTDVAVDLAGLVFRDNTGTSRVAGSLVVAPGDRAVLGKGSAASWCHPTLTPDGYFGGITLNNSNEAITLEFDGFAIDTTFFWNKTTPGTSFERIAPETCGADEDPGAWALATEAMGTERGTPGR